MKRVHPVLRAPRRQAQPWQPSAPWLGLAITREIVIILGGRTTLGNRADGGS
jgi:hypothetical protein